MTYNQAAITTKDNPFDPFDNFVKWYQFDCAQGYNSCSYLARLTNTSDSLSEVEYSREVERAIDSIILHDPSKLYRKVVRKVVVRE